jgi:hypothetical protein
VLDLDEARSPATDEARPGTRNYERQLAATLLRVTGDGLEQFAAHTEKRGKGPDPGGWVVPYLLAPDDVFEIPGSIFRYEHWASQIVSVNSERNSLERYREAVGWCDGELCRGPDRHTPARCLVVIFVGIGSSRSWEKGVAWRLAHLRTGYALNVLAGFARTAGAGVFERAAAGQPVMADVLELLPGREFVTAAVEITVDAGDRECH